MRAESCLREFLALLVSGLSSSSSSSSSSEVASESLSTLPVDECAEFSSATDAPMNAGLRATDRIAKQMINSRMEIRIECLPLLLTVHNLIEAYE